MAVRATSNVYILWVCLVKTKTAKRNETYDSTDWYFTNVRQTQIDCGIIDAFLNVYFV